MIQLDGYQIDCEISRSPRSLCYQGTCLKSGRSVIIKQPSPASPHRTTRQRLQREFDIGHSLPLSCTAEYLAFENTEKETALIMAEIDGTCLSDGIAGDGLPLDRFFELSLLLVSGLAAIHKQRILYGNLAPEHILIGPQSRSLAIIDFSVADYFSEMTLSGPESPDFHRNLLYMAPEQTGRMNLSADFRSDLYSLGTLLYEMLCGQPPFTGTDPAELAHAHLARSPLPPHHRNAAVPELLSRVVMKLLSKNPGDRYQACHGLLADLQKCQKEIAAGRDPRFPLAERDRATMLQIPYSLVGREKEERQLKTCLEAATGGAPQVVLVSGQAGIGKSVLVRSLKSVLQQQALFLSGKFDQGNLDQAYSALAEAYNGAIQHLLAATGESIETWTSAFREAIGENGRIITELIPDLQKLIEPQPPLPEVDPVSSKNRFNRIFSRFHQLFSDRSTPLILFLDDLQWADSASFDLLNSLVAAPGSTLLILAYRHDELDGSRGLNRLLEEIERIGIQITEIRLGPLERTGSNKLVAEMLSTKPDTVASLSDTIHHKTGGNPFFCREFLYSLYHSGLLDLSGDGLWQWDNGKIRGLEITENVVDLVTTNIERLQLPTRELLQLVSCIGNRADLRTLNLITQREERALGNLLEEAIEQHILIREGDEVRFSHDRIQEAGYRMIAEEERRKTHYRIGKALLKACSPEEKTNRLFEIVNQLNLGCDELQNRGEKRELAALNLEAGRKARLSAAFELACSYFNAGIALLHDDCWKQEHQLSFELFLSRAEAEFLTGQVDRAERHLEELLFHAKGYRETARVYQLQVILFTFLMKHREALESLKKAFRFSGFNIPTGRAELKRTLAKEKAELDRKLSTQGLDSLIPSYRMTDFDALLLISLVCEGTLSLYYLDPDLDVLCQIRCINLVFQKGFTENACQLFTAYGMLLCGLYHDYESASLFTQTALELSSPSFLVILKTQFFNK